MRQPGLERAAEHAARIADGVRRGEPIDDAAMAHTPRGRPVTVATLPPADMGGAFGLSAPGPPPVVLLRAGLGSRLARTVLAHELNHVDDLLEDPGPRHWIAREWRATAPLLASDPLGVLATAWATLSDRERRRFYRERLRGRD